MPEVACLESLPLKIPGLFFEDALVSRLLHVLGFDLRSSVVMVGEYIRRIFYYAPRARNVRRSPSKTA